MFQIKNKRVDKVNPLYYNKKKEKNKMNNKAHEIKLLKRSLKEQMNMALSVGARQNAHTMVLIIMKTSKK